MADFSIEYDQNELVCGLDEVGRGPLAGPVVAACVYIPEDIRQEKWIADVRDSKKLSETKREMLFDLIIQHCAHGIAEISPAEIDNINIFQASLKAMSQAYLNMNTQMDHALVDGKHIPKDLPCSALAIIKGDSKSKSIAAASIVAKVTRDRIMKNLALDYPQYGWDKNMGYPTAQHRGALEIYGVTDHHRRSYAPVRLILEQKHSIKNAS